MHKCAYMTELSHFELIDFYLKGCIFDFVPMQSEFVLVESLRFASCDWPTVSILDRLTKYTSMIGCSWSYQKSSFEQNSMLSLDVLLHYGEQVHRWVNTVTGVCVLNFTCPLIITTIEIFLLLLCYE